MRIGEALDTKIVAKSHNELLSKLDMKLQYSFEDTIDACIKYMKSLDINALKKAYEFFEK